MLTNASPASVGIPSDALHIFIQKLNSFDLPIHSILIARHGKLVTEAYYKPFEQGTLHRMFSISKSLTSIAIGLLIDEGQLTLYDPIIDHFPEYTPSEPHPWLSSMTIEDMLKMETCHTTTTYKKDPSQHWVESFFTTLPSHRPGTSFNYDTSSAHTLCALVEKITKMDLLDYLRKKCLDKIGFSKEAYLLKDPFGCSMGGSGLMATPMDLMKLAQLIMNEGLWSGEQLIPGAYLKAATSLQSYSSIQGTFPETRHGYGYQFWRIREDNFACFGMGGQLMIFLPKLDLIVITTADTQGMQGGNQLIYNCLFDELVPAIINRPSNNKTIGADELREELSHLSLKPLKGQLTNPPLVFLHNTSFNMEKNVHGFSYLTLTFDQEKKEGQLIFQLNGKSYNLPFGLGHLLVSNFPRYQQKCATSGVWVSIDCLHIKSNIIDETLGFVHFLLTIQTNTISVFMKKNIEDGFDEFTGYIEGLKSI